MSTGYKDLPGLSTILTGGGGKAATFLGGGLAKTLLGGASKALPYVGVAITAAEILGKVIGRGRKQANIWNELAFTPVSQRLANIFDQTTAGRKAGTLTYEDAQTALSDFETQASELQSAGDQFMGLGDKQALVVKQSRDFLGGSIDQWRKGLQGHIDALKPAASSSSNSMGTLLASPVDLAAAGHMTRRLEQERKQAAAGGRRSTLLSGPSGVSGPAPGQRRTLLGY